MNTSNVVRMLKNFLYRAEKEETLDHTLTSVDARGREYVKCRKTAFNGGSVVSIQYLT